MVEGIRKWLAVVMVGLMVVPAMLVAGAAENTNTPEGACDGRGGEYSPDASTVALWHFNENNGNVAADASGNGFDGSLNAPSWTIGKYGSALLFDGLDDEVLVPDLPGLNMQVPWSVEAWIKPGRDIGIAENVTIVSKATALDGWTLAIHMGRIHFDGPGPSYVDTYGPAHPWSADIWYHVAGTYDGTMCRMWEDGVVVGSETFSYSAQPMSGNLTIGGRTGRHFPGVIDEVRISNIARDFNGILLEDRITLRTDRPSYLPGDNVTLNAHVSQVQWSWEQKASGPTPRKNHAAVWDSTNRQMIIFAGEIATSPSGDLGDTWTYNPSTDIWVKKSSGPIDRDEPTGVWDPINKQMLIFGGYSQATTSFLGDLWAYYPANDTWVQKSSGAPARRAHITARDPATGTMYIFGGEGPGGTHRTDLWAYDPATDKWTQKSSRSVAGTSSSAAWDNFNNRLLVFGGGDGGSMLPNVLWAYYPVNDSWAQVATGAPARAGSTMVWDTQMQRILLFAGSSTTSLLDDLWAYYPTNNSWKQLKDGPNSRMEHTAIWDENDNGMIVFGGAADQAGISNDTWIYRQRATTGRVEWSTVSYVNDIPLRVQHSQVWDELNGRLIVQGGGYNNPRAYSDTWAFDPLNNSWSRLADGPDREGAVSVWNPLNRTMLVYSGMSLTDQYTSTLWSYNPSTDIWTQKASGPQGRRSSSGIWDPVNDNLIIFGGNTVNNLELNDTWAYHPANDTWKQLRSGPRARHGHSMFWDPTSSRMILYGGYYGSGGPPICLCDTWAYSPILDSWERLPDGPRARYVAGMAWWSSMNMAVLVGGHAIVGSVDIPLGDAWYWNPSNYVWAAAPNPPMQLAAIKITELGINGPIQCFGGGVPGNPFQNPMFSLYSSLGGDSVTFQINDPSDQPYFIMTNKTNLTGYSTVSLTLPMNAPEGTYNCSATANVSGTVLLAATSFKVRWPWSPVFKVVPFIIKTHDYVPDEMIGLNAYAGYEYPPASANKSAPGVILNAGIYYPNGTRLMNVTKTTDGTGSANLSFLIPSVTVNGTYTINISGFEGRYYIDTFNVKLPSIIIDRHTRFKIITSPANINRGAAFTISTVIENTMESNVNCFLVVQILDSKNVPIRPTIVLLNVTVTSDFIYNITLTIDMKYPTGLYNFQVQLLTGLPKDKGYALDFRNGTILVN